MSVIFWAGVPSYSCNVVVERFPNQPGPSRRYETIQVAGRNGDLLIDTGAYDNYTQPYEVYFNANQNKTPAGARAVRAWLQSPIGYQRLEDSYDPEFYRMAYYAGPTEIENAMNLFGRLTISFVCKPQRWRKDGERSIPMAKSQTLYNNLFPALPLIKVNGTAAGNLYVGSYRVQIKELNDYIMLDSELQDAYREEQNKNNTISTSAFPILEHGENTISWDGGITGIEVTPRWWTI